MTKTVTDELESIVSVLCEKYPDHSDDEIASLAHDVYARLSSEATVTAHFDTADDEPLPQSADARRHQSTKGLRPSVR
ncbi:MAG: hypothetical protein QOC69_1189 [Mycobacterium sp.]|jgi:hypothetical protein|nr:hypothetical protein [Mycobacterium sp.]